MNPRIERRSYLTKLQSISAALSLLEKVCRLFLPSSSSFTSPPRAFHNRGTSTAFKDLPLSSGTPPLPLLASEAASDETAAAVKALPRRRRENVAKVTANAVVGLPKSFSKGQTAEL